MALNDDASRKTTGTVLGQKRNLPFSNATMAVAGVVALGIGYMVYVNRSKNDNISRQPGR